MVIDHIGMYFFPDILIFRVIGRLAFPIFAWLIANGAIHTKNINNYLVRLFLLACITQPIYYLVNLQNHAYTDQLNVFFTLFTGLCAIASIRKIKNIFLQICIVLFFAAITVAIKSEYTAMGVLSIVFFYVFFKHKVFMALSQILIYSTVYIWMIVLLIMRNQFTFSYLQYFIQPLCLFSLVLIIFYNGREGKRIKYLFYLFYPLQYVIIYLLQKLVI